MPSVIHAITFIPAEAASIIASAANGGGTKINEASAPVAATPSETVLNMGLSKCSFPPRFGVIPPTI